ncbi:MAG: MFS transporter [Dehalococcoidales bacterium]|nr:MFS transporter [Dehalococcoidales bacterium]
MSNLPQTPPSERKRIWGLHPNVFFLGLVSLLNDMGSEMIFTLVPLFLANVLGAKSTIVGLVGGLSDSMDSIFRIISGKLSDRFGKRKSLAVFGYSLSTIIKPLMYVANSWGATLAIRFGDRLGKGIRTSPRDALAADSMEKDERGKGFGLHRAMDTMGAVLGLSLAAVIIYFLQQESLELSLPTYRWLVIFGSIPAVLSVLVLVTLVKERKRATESIETKGVSLSASNSLDSRFKLFLAIMVIFTLGKSSDFFATLRAQDLGAPVLQITLMLILFNITYALVSVPSGMLSDKLGRRKVIALGWLVYALVYLGFAAATALWHIWVLFAGYGIYFGITEGVARALVADMVPAHLRGTAYGWYHGVTGLALLPASLIAGWLWDKVNPAAPFYLGAALAFIAMMGLMTLLREPQHSTSI